MVLVSIFVALPVVLYGQFESADRQMRDLVTRAIQDRGALIAEALAPKLTNGDKGARASLNDDRQIFQRRHDPEADVPAWRGAPRRAFLFRGLCPQDPHRRDRRRARRARPAWHPATHLRCLRGQDAANEIRYKQANGAVELLTSIVPIRAADGAWVLTSACATSEFLNTSIGRPYWETREIRVAAAIYLVLAVIALLVAVSIRLGLRRFRDVAAEISQGRIGDSAFSHRNVVPELSSVARDFDKLVHDLRLRLPADRQNAEDKAHSFKTPLATIVPPSSRCGAPCRSTMRGPSAPTRSSTPR